MNKTIAPRKRQHVLAVFSLSILLAIGLQVFTTNQLKKQSWNLTRLVASKTPFTYTIGNTSLDWTGAMVLSNIKIVGLGSIDSIRVIPKRNWLLPTKDISHVVIQNPKLKLTSKKESLLSVARRLKTSFRSTTPQAPGNLSQSSSRLSILKKAPWFVSDGQIEWDTKDSGGAIHGIHASKKSKAIELTSGPLNGWAKHALGDFAFDFRGLDLESPLDKTSEIRALSLGGHITHHHNGKETLIKDAVVSMNTEEPGILFYGNTGLDSTLRLHWQTLSFPPRITARLNDTPLALFKSVLPEGVLDGGMLSGSFDALFSKEVHLSGNLDIKRVQLFHGSLSNHPLSFDGTLSGSLSMRKTSHDTLGIFEHIKFKTKGIVLEAAGSFRKNHDRTWPNDWISTIRLFPTTCQTLYKSLPPAFTRRIRGAEFKGDIKSQIELSYNQKKNEAIIDDQTTNGCTLKTPSPLSDIGSTFEKGVFHLASGKQVASVDFAKLNRLPKHVPHAFVSAEDGRFYRHSGFDLRQIERSLAVNAKNQHFLRGGSTISQQLIKNIFLGHERTFARKSEEAILTWQLEKEVSKQTILETYLNIVQLAPHGVHGIKEASASWFGKRPTELRVAEAAFLAALTREPTAMTRRIASQKGLDEKSLRNTLSVLRALRRDDIITIQEMNRSQKHAKELTFDFSSKVFLDP